MRILFVTNFMDVGGIETSLIQLAPELKRRGHEVSVLSSGGVLERELEQQQVPHVRMSVNLWHPFQLIRTAVSLRQYLRHEHFDIVHAMSAAGNLATLLSRNSASAGTHFVSSPMGLQNSEHEFPVVTYLRNWLLTIQAERVLLISEAIEE
ncbi:MAG: glycosyltransferase, partial [Chloroflexota bacterium]